MKAIVVILAIGSIIGVSFAYREVKQWDAALIDNSVRASRSLRAITGEAKVGNEGNVFLKFETDLEALISVLKSKPLGLPLSASERYLLAASEGLDAEYRQAFSGRLPGRIIAASEKVKNLPKYDRYGKPINRAPQLVTFSRSALQSPSAHRTPTPLEVNAEILRKYGQKSERSGMSGR